MPGEGGPDGKELGLRHLGSIVSQRDDEGSSYPSRNSFNSTHPVPGQASP